MCNYVQKLKYDAVSEKYIYSKVITAQSKENMDKIEQQIINGLKKWMNKLCIMWLMLSMYL